VFGVYVRLEEADIFGKRRSKAFVRHDRIAAQTLFDSIVGECRQKQAGAEVDLIDLDEDRRLQRKIIEVSSIDQAWAEWFPPITGVRTY
jgi:hypothetical protein